MGPGKDGFCSQDSGEPQKVVEGESKGSECFTSRHCGEQEWIREAPANVQERGHWGIRATATEKGKWAGE